MSQSPEADGNVNSLAVNSTLVTPFRCAAVRQNALRYLKNIYKYIIENGLYDPNWNIGVSSEPLFTMLPNSSDLYSVNIKNNKYKKIKEKI